MAVWPFRGQTSPKYWDLELKAYIDENDLASGGRELAYAESAALFTTTDNATLNTRVTGLALDLVGEGNTVDIEFSCGEAWHSVANTQVLFYLVVNDVALSTFGIICSAMSPRTDKGVGAHFKKRLVLADGVAYNFKVGMFLGAAGTGSAKGDPSSVMYLTATQR